MKLSSVCVREICVNFQRFCDWSQNIAIRFCDHLFIPKCFSGYKIYTSTFFLRERHFLNEISMSFENWRECKNSVFSFAWREIEIEIEREKRLERVERTAVTTNHFPILPNKSNFTTFIRECITLIYLFLLFRSKFAVCLFSHSPSPIRLNVSTYFSNRKKKRVTCFFDTWNDQRSTLVVFFFLRFSFHQTNFQIFFRGYFIWTIRSYFIPQRKKKKNEFTVHMQATRRINERIVASHT